MMRLTLAFVFVVAAAASAEEAEKRSIELTGTIDGRGLPMAECDSGVHRIKLILSVDTKGEGTGTLVLDATPSPVDDYGFPVTVKADPPLKLECMLKRVGSKKVLGEGAPAVEVEWQLYEITGPKIVSKLSLAREARADWSYARFLWATKEGKDRTLVQLAGPQPKIDRARIEPCHPGCFPAGTRVDIAAGTKAIEDIRAGEAVTTVGPDGKPGQIKVAAMFVTRNRLIQVNVEGKTLITTATQPLALADGKFRAAGELKPSDHILVWAKGERTSVPIKSVEVTDREAPVYNLILGDPVLFVANGFLARSKPPTVVTPP